MTILTEKYRPKTIEEVIGLKQLGFEIDQNIPHLLMYGPPGTGKCLGYDTPVIMFDGTVKPVQDVINGDLIMGPDSKPRKVSGVTRGFGDLYEVVPIKGDRFVCNGDHILNLRMTGTDALVNIALHDYVTKGNDFKHKAKLWRSGIEFDEKFLAVSPYVTGLWLGDGTRDHPHITHTINDVEIVPDIKQEADRLGLKLHYTSDTRNDTGTWKILNGTGPNGGKPNTFLNHVRSLVINGEKRIPHEYLVNSRQNRLELLAGLIDTDGYMSSNCIEIVTKYEGLARDIRYLVNSLGMFASVTPKESSIKELGFTGMYYRILISGDTSIIPIRIARKKCTAREQIKDVTNTGFSVNPIGIGNYYGFSLDGDGLFLLGDFTVTHNTSLAKIIIRTLGADHKVFNSSMDRGIETIRSKVSEFASTRSTDGNIKICFLDEADGLSYDAQNSLRNLMETYSDNFRLILTANNLTKINDAIRSRCTEIEFGNAPVDDVCNRLIYICTSEGIPCDARAARKIAEIGKGDIRRCINIIEDMKDGVTLDKITVGADTVNEIYMSLKKGDFFGARGIYLASKIDDIELMKELHQVIFDSSDNNFSKCVALRCIAYCAVRYNNAAWKEILVENTLLGISEAYSGKAEGYVRKL